MKNPIAIITGAAKGIGFALAKQCLQKNIDVIAVDIDESALAEMQQALQFSAKLETMTVDVSQAAQIVDFAKEVLKNHGIPSYLFNNVGIGGDMLPLWEQDIEKFKQVMEINFFSAFYLTKSFLPVMLQAKIRGAIVNTASMASFYTAPLISSYVISKHSMMAFSECLYHDLQAINSDIQVSVVCPGGVRTSILDDNLQAAGQYEKKLEQLNSHSKNFIIKFAKLIKKGMTADTAAEIIFAGIEEKQFYIFTHPEMLEVVKRRFEAVLQLEKPQALGL